MSTSLYRMYQRRGTKQQWESANPVLAVGEIGFSFNENVIKLGDGQTAWNSLPSVNGNSAYQVAKVNGYTGTESQWLASLVGPTGPQGPPGITNAHQSVVTMSTGTGAASTYFPGTAGADGGTGVGAYIEANANGAIVAINGVTPTVGQRVLFDARADSKENGIYSLTNAGSVSAKWRFTRTADYDNATPEDVNTGDFVVITGGTFANKTYIMNAVGTGTNGSIKIGTDDITWTETGGVGPTGATGPTGPSGVIAVTAPITNSGTSTSANLGIDYSTLQYGQNEIINGAFDIWQRGTSISVSADATYTADRWIVQFNGSGATRTVSQQAFTPGAAPVAGYEGTHFLRFAQSVAGSGATFTSIGQRIENVRTFAGQTVTVSFWAKAASAMTIPNITLWQNFGTGGSSTAGTDFAPSLSIGTSWTRYSYTVTLPSISGKTIGANSYLQLEMYQPLNQTFTFDLWGVQVEAGSTATPFRRNGPNIQAELAACQRYFVSFTNDGGQFMSPVGIVNTTSTARFSIPLPVTMRTVPTLTYTQSSATGQYIGLLDLTSSTIFSTFPNQTIALLFDWSTSSYAGVQFNLTGATSLTVGRPVVLQAQANLAATGRIALNFSAEI